MYVLRRAFVLPADFIFTAMKNRFQLTYFLAPLLLFSCSISKSPDRRIIRDLEYGKVKEDTSFVYHLPYAEDKKYLLVQGYFSRFFSQRKSSARF